MSDKIHLPNIDEGEAYVSRNRLMMRGSYITDNRHNICYVHSQPLEDGGEKYMLFLLARNSGDIETVYGIGITNNGAQIKMGSDNLGKCVVIGPFQEIYETKNVVDFLNNFCSGQEGENIKRYLNHEGLFVEF